MHLVRHSLNFCGWKDRKAVAKDLKLIYQAVDDGEAAKALDDFEAEWGDKYPSIAPSWRRAWQEVIPFFAFPPAVRKIIYTTNAIESLNRVIRKTTKTRGSFPTDAAATKLIYLAIRNFEKAGRCVREWVAARNQFAILYPERFNKSVLTAWAERHTQSFRYSLAASMRSKRRLRNVQRKQAKVYLMVCRNVTKNSTKKFST